MKKIAIIGANIPLLPFFKRTKELGFEIHCFAWEEGAICKPYADYFYPISFTEQDRILEVCKEIDIDGITSFSLESALPTVNYVAENLGLVSNSIDSLKYTSNKYLMRNRLSVFEIGIPKYKLIENREQLYNISIPFPLIVKPVDNGGSRGVTKVDSDKELLLAYDRALSHSKIKQVLLEEYIDGRELSVEYISNKGNHYNIAVTDKVTTGSPYFIELEHHQPAKIASSLLNEVKRITEIVLTALNISNSPSHTEVKIDKNNCIYIIEVGPRMGGGRITSDLVKLSTNYDFIEGALDLAIGNFNVPLLGNIGYSGIYYWTSKTNYVKYYLENDFKEIIYSEINTEIRDSLNSNLDRNGFFIYKSDMKYEIE